MKVILITAIILLSATAQAAPFAKGDATTGKKLFSQNNCNACHISMLGGDGNTMFTRAERKVKTPAALATQIMNCSTNLGLMLFEENEAHLGAYLNKSFYKFK